MKNSGRIEIWKRLAADFSIIPLEPNSKKPIEMDWPQWCKSKRPFNPPDFKGKNAGVVCGWASGIIELDEDIPELFESYLQSHNLNLPTTYKVKTGSGLFHHYFRYPSDGQEYGNRGLKNKFGFDIKANKGMVVAPGSIHPDTGKPYQIVNDIPMAPAPEWLLDLSRKTENPKIRQEQNQTLILNSIDIDPDTFPVSEHILLLIKNGKPKGYRSEAMMSVINALVAAEISDADIIALFESQPIGEKYREKGKSRERWLLPQIANGKGHRHSGSWRNEKR